MMKAKPTPAQLKYLRNAQLVCDAGTGKGNRFNIDGPGHWDTGGECYRLKWIIEGQYEKTYFITPAGRAVLDEALEAEG